MRRTTIGPVAVIACLALTLPLAACGGKKKVEPPRAALTVSTATVTQTLLPRTVDASGSITAWQEVVVGAETGGLTAVEVLADEGTVVRQGQLILKMNDELLSAQLKQADAQVISARATLAQADADLKRSQDLNAKGYLAKAALDQKVAAQGTAAASVTAAQAARAEAAARLDQSNVRAPVSGLITSRKVVKGQIVTAGSELFRLVRDGRLELAAQVPETQLAAVRTGMTATVTSDQVGKMNGVVRLVTPQVDPTTRVGLARIALASPAGFRPGMFAAGAINVGALPALTVPQSAVLYRDNKPGIFVVDAQDVAHYRQVVTGAHSGDLLEIVQGVTAGEKVAVAGAGFLAEGDHVRVAAAAGAR